MVTFVAFAQIKEAPSRGYEFTRAIRIFCITSVASQLVSSGARFKRLTERRRILQRDLTTMTLSSNVILLQVAADIDPLAI